METIQKLTKLEKLWKHLRCNQLFGMQVYHLVNMPSSLEKSLTLLDQLNPNVSVIRKVTKLMIAKYGNIHGPACTFAKYVKQFPKLTESTVRKWIRKYRKELPAAQNNQISISIGEK